MLIQIKSGKLSKQKRLEDDVYVVAFYILPLS